MVNTLVSAALDNEPTANPFEKIAGFEGGLTAVNCALQGMRPEQLVFASDYPQDFTGVNTDTGKGMLDNMLKPFASCRSIRKARNEFSAAPRRSS